MKLDSDSGVVNLKKKDPLVWRHGVDLALLLGEEEAYAQAAIVLCNELKARFRSRRVSLGWLENGRVELQASSDTREFDRRSDEAANISRAMEECVDQNEEIFHPSKGSNFVVREHERLAEREAVDALVSVTLRVKGVPVGAITLERNEEAFTSEEVFSLRLAADLIANCMQSLRHRSRWFGVRAFLALRDCSSKFLGPAGLWWKVGAFLVLLFFAVAAILPWRFQVDADFSLKTDAIVHVVAPFDGFIGEVNASVGDDVEATQSLLLMNTKDLEVQIAEAEASHARQIAEERSARGEGAFADAETARLRMREAEAQLKLLRKRLERSFLSSPFDGLVIEGDLRERIGSPVKQGEILFKIARLQGLYSRLSVDEREILEVEEGASGQLAFVSRPDRRFSFRVVRIEPAALSSKEGNVFRLRAEFEEPAESWWRPGMEGVAKIDAGERTLLWVLTRRMIDWVRLKLWL